MHETLMKARLTVPADRESEAVTCGWLEGRAPEPEDVAETADMAMSDLLFHVFGPDAGPYKPRESAVRPAERLYAPRGSVDASDVSPALLRALSACGVEGTIRLRSLREDVEYTLNGAGGLVEREHAFLD